jgi:hypothetical protein
MAPVSQGCTAVAQGSLFTHKSAPVIFKPPRTNVMERLMGDRRM